MNCAICEMPLSNSYDHTDCGAVECMSCNHPFGDHFTTYDNKTHGCFDCWDCGGFAL